ncbi:MAG: hypothetical protein JJE12_06495 [Anaerolineales bacterium]|nr:hypothetical protein [Anaerolineales bacterium]
MFWIKIDDGLSVEPVKTKTTLDMTAGGEEFLDGCSPYDCCLRSVKTTIRFYCTYIIEIFFTKVNHVLCGVQEILYTLWGMGMRSL